MELLGEDILTSILRPWGFLAFFILIFWSYLIGQLYDSSRIPKSTTKKHTPDIILASLLTYFLFSMLMVNTCAVFGIPAHLLDLFFFGIPPLLTLAFVGGTWFPLVVNDDFRYLVTAIIILGCITTLLGFIFVVYMPFVSPGQPLSFYLYWYIFPVTGGGLIFLGFYKWSKRRK